MFKRTKGYILLTLLVLTGLAGRINSEIITTKERKQLLDQLKISKTTLLQTVEGLSIEQLNYRTSSEKWSVKDCIMHLALAEENLWELTETALKQRANVSLADKRITDKELLSILSDRSKKLEAHESLKPEKAKWKNVTEALEDFKKQRNRTIKFAKNTTDDLRGHLTSSNLGTIDTYQSLLLIAAHTSRHIQQIVEIKSKPGFQKRR